MPTRPNALRRPKRILVTGVGGAPGFDLARSLMRLGCDVIGIDANPLAAGLLLPVTPRVTAPASDPDYAARLLRLCRELAPEALLPTMEQELAQLITMRDRLDELGVQTWLPQMSAVEACGDKALFHAALRAQNLPTPRTFLPHQLGDVPDEYPLVVKPRRGHGAKDVIFCRTRRQAAVLCELVPEPIVQERVSGSEFTADCLVDHSGRASVILRRRLLVKNGLAMVASTFHDDTVAGLVKAVLHAVGIVGLCCVQGFIRDTDTAGEHVVITEVNARVAGAFPLSEAAGADLVDQALNGLAGLPIDHNRLAYRAGVYLTKYVETLSVREQPATRGPRADATTRSSGPVTRKDMTMARLTTPAAVAQNARPFLHGPELAAATEAMQEGQYGHGARTERFEDAVARFLGVPDIVAVSSGTAALRIALMVAGIGPGDEVIVPSQTFCATIQAIIACGAHPRFIEVNPNTLCVEPHAVLDAITPATRAVMPVLYGGRAADLTSVQNLLDDHDITVIEDAAQAFGSRRGPTRVGADPEVVTCFSFGPIKSLTCLNGGAIIPRNTREADTARRLRALGIIQSQAQRIATTSYSVDGFGLRATLSSVNAAVGSVQLDRFSMVEATRKTLWRAYAARLRGLKDVALIDLDVDHTVPFNCVIRVPARDEIHRLLRNRGIGVGVHYPPNHLQPAFAQWHRNLPVTEKVGREILSLPFHPEMTTEGVDYVVAMLEQALARARVDASAS